MGRYRNPVDVDRIEARAAIKRVRELLYFYSADPDSLPMQSPQIPTVGEFRRLAAVVLRQQEEEAMAKKAARLQGHGRAQGSEPAPSEGVRH
jgi:hypothetical protein